MSSNELYKELCEELHYNLSLVQSEIKEVEKRKSKLASIESNIREKIVNLAFSHGDDHEISVQLRSHQPSNKRNFEVVNRAMMKATSGYFKILGPHIVPSETQAELVPQFISTMITSVSRNDEELDRAIEFVERVIKRTEMRKVVTLETDYIIVNIMDGDGTIKTVFREFNSGKITNVALYPNLKTALLS